MQIILTMVLSVDGRSNKWGQANTHLWASKEDQTHLEKLIKENNLIIFGRRTYQAVQNNLKLSEDKLRVVLTRDPKKFKNEEVPGQLEFSNEGVRELVRRLSSKGYTKMLLLSGEKLNSAFFKEKLISEIYLTIEPKVFGLGNGMIFEEKLDINLKLISVEKLNEQGTLLLHYQVR